MSTFFFLGSGEGFRSSSFLERSFGVELLFLGFVILSVLLDLDLEVVRGVFREFL